ncbi:hypothetical protein OTU49_010307 [Cherax quadricarinatus]|uniref:Coiled-coil domain-containing protein 53 n=1 Tax=Cherax quadricarinatus TaxID=27406 RepID=A0AAW0W8R3_CHEQU|nr:WASH complex subunit 3-like [Cherax quadricarinatus]
MERTSVVTPNVDLTKVEAINQKRTLAFINHWTLHTVAFLNQFSAVCEERLLNLDTKLRRADHTLAILESKLSSVPGLEGVVAPTSDSSQVATNNTDSAVTEKPETISSPNIDAINATHSATANTEVEPESTDEAHEVSSAPAATPVSQDPRYIQYFRMLKMGVPAPAIKMKMSNEGVDPCLLDDPNAAAPPQDATVPSRHDSDSDTSSASSWSD